MSDDNKHHDLEINKIAAAVLLAGVLAMFSGLGAKLLYGSDHAGHDEKRGYAIEVVDNAGSGAPKEEVIIQIAEFMPAADIAKGESMIKKCTACHTFEKGGNNGVGPNNWAIMGSSVAHKSDYVYSDAFAALKDRSWDEQSMSEFLRKPKAYVPGNKMSFAGIKKPQDRANLIAYLNTLK